MKTCYVSMPFGVKRDATSGRTLDHDRVYHELIAPAAEEAGLFCQRADDFAGTLIHKDIARAIVTADVMLADVSNGNDALLDEQLQKVIDTVTASVAARGYHPQLASQTKLHANLWENLECQMLACGRGIAIVEDRFNPKLNPNVAMEWGWMRAMKKPVLYLVEKSVAYVPADVAGLINSRFDWNDPQATIPQLVAQDLP